MRTGRPSKYKGKETLTKTREYLESCGTSFESVGAGPGARVVCHVKLPSIEGLARHLATNRETIYDWREKHEEFSDVIGSLKALQAESLINNGLSGAYNATIAKVLLAKHGYREGVEHVGEGGGPILVGLEEALKKVYGV